MSESPSSSTAPDQWLIRTFQNRILGPFSAMEIRGKILARELTPDDEICQANSYWFALHEQSELKTQLGIELPPRARQDDDEVTDTETSRLSFCNPRETEGSPSGFTHPDSPRKLPAIRMETVGVSQRQGGGFFERPALLRILAWTLLLATLGLLVWVYVILNPS